MATLSFAKKIEWIKGQCEGQCNINNEQSAIGVVRAALEFMGTDMPEDVSHQNPADQVNYVISLLTATATPLADEAAVDEATVDGPTAREEDAREQAAAENVVARDEHDNLQRVEASRSVQKRRARDSEPEVADEPPAKRQMMIAPPRTGSVACDGLPSTEVYAPPRAGFVAWDGSPSTEVCICPRPNKAELSTRVVYKDVGGWHCNEAHCGKRIPTIADREQLERRYIYTRTQYTFDENGVGKKCDDDVQPNAYSAWDAIDGHANHGVQLDGPVGIFWQCPSSQCSRQWQQYLPNSQNIQFGLHITLSAPGETVERRTQRRKPSQKPRWAGRVLENIAFGKRYCCGGMKKNKPMSPGCKTASSACCDKRSHQIYQQLARSGDDELAAALEDREGALSSELQQALLPLLAAEAQLGPSQAALLPDVPQNTGPDFTSSGDDTEWTDLVDLDDLDDMLANFPPELGLAVSQQPLPAAQQVPNDDDDEDDAPPEYRSLGAPAYRGLGSSLKSLEPPSRELLLEMHRTLGALEEAVEERQPAAILAALKAIKPEGRHLVQGLIQPLLAARQRAKGAA